MAPFRGQQKHKGLPQNWFPMSPVSSYWNLDADENIDMSRRGFPLVPNFSSTIDSATGRTLNSEIADLGDIGSNPSFYAAMRGYIALSRVRAAHRLLISQPFNPLLFRQGPQPFPTLLLEVLLGKVSSDEVEAKCFETRVQCKNVKLFKNDDVVWACSQCKDSKQTADFLPSPVVSYYDDVLSHVIQPGRLRCCRQCRTRMQCSRCKRSLTVDSFSESRRKHRHHQKVVCAQCESDSNSHPCDMCKVLKERSEYSDRMWQNRQTPTHRTLCWQCCRPQCTAQNCQTCRVCRSETCRNKSCAKDMTMPHARLLPATWDEVQSYVCGSCRHACELCGEAHGEKGYTPSMWHHRFTKNQRTLCLRCCRPPCTAKACQTCVVCRDPTCKRRKCNNAIVALNPKQLPSTLEDIHSFLCQRCEEVTCRCGTRMSATFQKKRKATLGSKPYVCLTCITKEQQQRDKDVKVHRR